MKHVVVYEDDVDQFGYPEWIDQHVANREPVVREIQSHTDRSRSSIRRYLRGDGEGGVEFAVVASDVLETDAVEHVARYLAWVYEVVEWRLFYGASKAIVDRVRREGSE